MSMKCPACNSHTSVVETRKRATGLYRRYECGKMHRFSLLDGVLIRMDKEKLGAGRPFNVKPKNDE